MSCGTDITRPEVVLSWRVSSDHLAPTREYRIPSGGKMARRYRITSTFITLMGEHISQVTMDRTGLPRDGYTAESRFACVCVHAHRILSTNGYISLLLSSRNTSGIYLLNPVGRKRWRATVQALCKIRSLRLILSRDDLQRRYILFSVPQTDVFL